MAHKERIDFLLLDIRELEQKVAGMRDAEIYPVSFFSQSFELAHKILTDLHSLEADQLKELSRQMEEHRQHLSFLPAQEADSQPATHEPAIENIPQTEEPSPSIVQKEEKIETKSIIKETPPAEIKTSVSLNEILEKKKLSDFRKAFSLNDRFRFRRELFGGDETRMNQAIADLDQIRTYEESVTYLHEKLKWNVEDEAVADFLKLIEKRFM